MRALKALVIVMGVLLVAGMALVGYTIVKRASAPEPPGKPTTSPPIPPPPIAGPRVKTPYGPVEVALPPGARIKRVRPAGERLIVELELADGGERVLVLELSTGALVGTIDLKPQP